MSSHCDALQVIGYSSNLTVFISPDTVGSYTCMVAVKGYRQIQATGQVYQRGVPVMEGGGKVEQAALGDSVQLSCEGRAQPQVDTVSWRYKDRPLDTASQHYQVITKKKQDKVSSTLVIRNVALSDFGVYNCTLRNSYGQDSSLIEVVRKGKC